MNDDSIDLPPYFDENNKLKFKKAKLLFKDVLHRMDTWKIELAITHEIFLNPKISMTFVD